MHKKVEIVEYDSGCPMILKKEKCIISNALGRNCVAVHHVGLISVVGIVAGKFYARSGNKVGSMPKNFTTQQILAGKISLLWSEQEKTIA